MIFNPIVSGGGASAPFFEITQEELEHYLYDAESAVIAAIYTNPPPDASADPCLILPVTNIISSSMVRGNVEFNLQDGFHYYLVSIGGEQIIIMNESENILTINHYGVESPSGWSVRLFVYQDKTA